MIKNIVMLLASIIVCQLAGVIGGIATGSSVDTWYIILNKPVFTPPGSLIGAVWIILYAIMGISAFLILKKGLEDQNVRNALYVFAFQLLLNILWSVAFFGFRSILAGIIVIILLWLAVLWTIIKFYKIDKISAWLLVPYILWVSFASILNAAFLILNL
ncbi:MAG: tryptophan-rich sensory protein [Candidatus Saganbacteria bacterium]|nr:tryptophan-rich sensory protein [Candidatus Saganbacteria bacterium]